MNNLSQTFFSLYSMAICIMQKSTLPEMKSIMCRWAVTSDTETEHLLYEDSSFCSTRATAGCQDRVPGGGGGGGGGQDDC